MVDAVFLSDEIGNMVVNKVHLHLTPGPVISLRSEDKWRKMRAIRTLSQLLIKQFDKFGFRYVFHNVYLHFVRMESIGLVQHIGRYK